MALGQGSHSLGFELAVRPKVAFHIRGELEQNPKKCEMRLIKK